MPPPPDELPRSPTGRIPQWVVDQATGAPLDPAGWRTPTSNPPAARRRRRAPVIAGIVILAALGGVGWLATGARGLPGAVSALQSHLSTAPSAEVVALADDAHLSAEGRDLFYGTHPQVLGAAAFAGRCADGQTQSAQAGGSTVGCFEPGANSIVLYEPADPRLHGSVVESAAHETLHAAWARLSTSEQAQLTPLLEAVVASLAPDDPIRDQIAGSVGTHADHRPTELFAYVGTQVWRPGGLGPQLEAAYARVIADRAALVAVHTSWHATLDGMAAEIHSASQALATREATTAQLRAQYTADAASVAYYRRAYQTKAAEVAAMPTAQRARLLLSWAWWDGTTLPMAPAEQTLTAAAALLTRDEAALPARDAAIRADEAAAATERTRVQGLVAGLQALDAQLDPGPTH